MREVKFRTLNKNLNKMTIAPSEDISLMLSDTGATVAFWCSDGIFDEIPADELMQYTGLKDKNGVEIYEGDVLLCKDDRFPVEIKFYNDGCFRPILFGEVKFLTVNQWMTSRKRAMRGTPCLVIGNIHETPELLEADNGNG